jgi:hypothetical protein
MKMKAKKLLSAACLALAIGEVSVQAIPSYTYQPTDLLAAFGKAGSANDVIVDLGPIGNYYPLGSTSIAGVSTALNTAFSGNLDGLYWSVFGYAKTTSSLFNANTLFVSNPDTNPDDAVNSLTSGQQGQVVSKMTAIALSATSGYATIVANQIANVPIALNVGGSPVSYTVGVGSLGDFNGTWRWDVRNITPTGFTTGTTPSVAALYEQDPGVANVGLYRGTVSLAADGTLTIEATPEPSTWAMLGAGLVTWMLIRRKNKTISLKTN